MEVNTEFFCCAVNEFDGISSQTPARSIQNFLDFITENKSYPRFVVFTATGRYGEALKRFIVQKHLGTVIQTRGVNPKTSHIVDMYVWTIDYKAFGKYYLSTIEESDALAEIEWPKS